VDTYPEGIPDVTGISLDDLPGSMETAQAVTRITGTETPVINTTFSSSV
jgi:hypothetical protein